MAEITNPESLFLNTLLFVICYMCECLFGVACVLTRLLRWASEIAERLFCVANHLRRIKHSVVRWRQCCVQLNESEKDLLQQIVDDMEPWVD